MPDLSRALILVLAASCAVGCASQPSRNYAWGSYEEVIYVAWTRPGEMPPERAAEALEKDLQAARSENKPVPPGWHAHLGWVYFQLGRLDQCRQELLTEKSMYPESTVFVDRLLANLEHK